MKIEAAAYRISEWKETIECTPEETERYRASKTAWEAKNVLEEIVIGHAIDHGGGKWWDEEIRVDYARIVE